MLETLAHTPVKMLDAKAYDLVTLLVPEKIPIQKILLSNLSSGWDAPDARSFTKNPRDHFLYEKVNLLLEVQVL